MDERLYKIAQGIYEIEKQTKAIKDNLEELKEALEEYETELATSDYKNTTESELLISAIRGHILLTSFRMDDVIKPIENASKYTKEYTKTYNK